MESYKRLLIISNNSLSLTSNNGKTIYSLFEEYPKNYLFQLFTRDELPQLKIGSYFKITNKDVVKGRICKKKRGSRIDILEDSGQREMQIIKPSRIKRNSLNCLIREMLWVGGWKSKQLDEWLDEINPEIIFFVAGDTLYSYAICNYVAYRTKAKINIYITDDYINKKRGEDIFDIVRRKMLYKRLEKILYITKSFFTISDKMRIEYKDIFGKDSMPVFNISESLRNDLVKKRRELLFVYAGSLYYGRDEVLVRIAQCIQELNNDCGYNAFLEVYSGQEISDSQKNKLDIDGASCFCGALNREELRIKLNEADILLFVESFDILQIEKTRLSFSTKISEYLSVGKPILAVGPEEIGSMEFLSSSAICVYRIGDIKNELSDIIKDKELRNEYAEKSLTKYKSMGNIHDIRNMFIEELCRA